MLSQRQRAILEAVVGGYLETGRPVGSKVLAESGDLGWGASTIRAELAALEEAGYLAHPHTSAGRVPTDSGYRLYADELIGRSEKLPQVRVPVDLSAMRREIDTAMREVTAALSRVNDLVALATAPPPSSTVIRRIEVFALQPSVVMVIVIASNGSVAKQVFSFSDDVDPGLVEWSSSYLNERLTGIEPGSRRIGMLLADTELGRREAEFVQGLAPAFESAGDNAPDALYVDGVGRLLSPEHASDLTHASDLLDALEGRASFLEMLRHSLDKRTIFAWIGEENPHPELRDVAVVGANYGLGYRNLGAIGVLGPLRMDYATAIATVRDAAGELSRFFESVYER